MRILWLPVLLVLIGAPLVFADPPADAFCVITIEGLEDFRIVRVTVDEETTLEDRAALWPQVDMDGDGAIPPAEKHAFARSTLQLWPDTLALGLRNLELQRSTGAAEPLFAATWREVGHTFHQRDYATPETVTQTADLETQEVREFRFGPGPVDEVVLYGGGAKPDEPIATGTTTFTTTPTYTIEYVVVRAPPGWIVSSITAHTYDGAFSRSYADAVVDVPAMDTKRPYEVTFMFKGIGDQTTDVSTTVPTTDGSSTVPGASIGVVAVVALAAALRRRLP